MANLEQLAKRVPLERARVSPEISAHNLDTSKPTPLDPFKELNSIELTAVAYPFDNPVALLLTLNPEISLYKWQFEEMMRVAGYLTTGKYSKEDKTPISRIHPYRLVLAAANGSGKDAIVIAYCALWYAVSGQRNRVIITSSSFEQIKFQTEPAIVEVVRLFNKKFGRVIRSVQFHHVISSIGSEIKMFATDDPGHAEGYHAWGGGGIMRIVNEAKTVREEIHQAMARWTGITHHLEISSPGIKSGHMYNVAETAIQYPGPAQLSQYFFRRVTAFDCPHISKAHIDAQIAEFGEDSPLVRSSIHAEFTEFGTPVIIPEDVFIKCLTNPPPHQGSKIGIGLDLAGGGDEDAIFVREGNKVIYSYFFRQADTDLAAEIIDARLDPWRRADYDFRADNGGVGQGIIDRLVRLGWNITRTNNQSPANRKSLFLNLGAEVWYHVARLITHKLIILPSGIDKFQKQMTTRQWKDNDSNQGKFCLESKKEAKLAGRPSPDRADAFNLCFFSYRPGFQEVPKVEKPTERLFTAEELFRIYSRGLPDPNKIQHSPQHFTLLRKI